MAANNAIKKNGYAGLDYNMAVLCIAAQRTGIKVEFPQRGESYDRKLEYWISKRRANAYYWKCDTDDELLLNAWADYGL